MTVDARPGHLRHDLAMAAAVGAVVIGALMLSTRSAGYPSPGERARPVPDIAAQARADRDAAIFRFSLLCLSEASHGKPAEAIADCSKALLLDPSRADLLVLRGNTEVMIGRLADAVRDYSRAIAIAPKEPAPYRFRAAAYTMMARDQDAFADFARALALAPGDPLTLELRGHLYQLRNRHALAIADYSAAIARTPEVARLWNSRCWARVVANRELAAALADCDRAIRLDPKSAYAQDSRGFALIRLGRFADAVVSFDAALKIAPRFSSSLFGRGLARLMLHDGGGLRDVAAARAIEPGIAARLGKYGFRLPARTPSGA